MNKSTTEKTKLTLKFKEIMKSVKIKLPETLEQLLKLFSQKKSEYSIENKEKTVSILNMTFDFWEISNENYEEILSKYNKDWDKLSVFDIVRKPNLDFLKFLSECREVWVKFPSTYVNNSEKIICWITKEMLLRIEREQNEVYIVDTINAQHPNWMETYKNVIFKNLDLETQLELLIKWKYVSAWWTNPSNCSGTIIKKDMSKLEMSDKQKEILVDKNDSYIYSETEREKVLDIIKNITLDVCDKNKQMIMETKLGKIISEFNWQLSWSILYSWRWANDIDVFFVNEEDYRWFLLALKKSIKDDDSFFYQKKTTIVKERTMRRCRYGYIQGEYEDKEVTHTYDDVFWGIYYKVNEWIEKKIHVILVTKIMDMEEVFERDENILNSLLKNIEEKIPEDLVIWEEKYGLMYWREDELRNYYMALNPKIIKKDRSKASKLQKIFERKRRSQQFSDIMRTVGRDDVMFASDYYSELDD